MTENDEREVGVRVPGARLGRRSVQAMLLRDLAQLSCDVPRVPRGRESGGRVGVGDECGCDAHGGSYRMSDE